jgi:hypothetical protein
LGPRRFAAWRVARFTFRSASLFRHALSLRSAPVECESPLVEFAWNLREVCVKRGSRAKGLRRAIETFILFSPFRLGALNEQLWRDNEPKPFAVLANLVMHPGRLVIAAEQHKVVWLHTCVGAGLLRGYVKGAAWFGGIYPERRTHHRLRARGFASGTAPLSGVSISPSQLPALAMRERGEGGYWVVKCPSLTVNTPGRNPLLPIGDLGSQALARATDFY